MKEQEKKQITGELATYCDRFGSQNKAANSLKGVSTAIISQMLNNNWDTISDDMFRSVAAQIGFRQNSWVTVETRGYKRMYSLLEDSQQNSEVFAITGDAGCGKSEAITSYTRTHKNVFMVSCSEYWNRKYFLVELLKAMGRESAGFTVAEMMDDVIFFLKRAASPLLIMDEFDKLTDQVLNFFITIYNAVNDHCGIVISSTNYLERRITRGLRSNRKGYSEIFSRFGRKFIPMPSVGDSDIAAVCMANGVGDVAVIEGIINDSDGDLRRVKRLIHASKKSFGKKNG